MCVQPADGSPYVFVFDDVGLLQKIRPDQAEVALERGEIEETNWPGRVRLVEQPIRELTPQEKRAIELQKQRDAAERKGRRR